MFRAPTLLRSQPNIFRRYSTIQTPPNSNLITNYLTTTLNFTPKDAFTLSLKGNLTHLKSTLNPNLVLTLFKNYGLNHTQIKKVITHVPKILSCKASKTLEPKLDVFRNLGLSSNDLVNLIRRNPEVFGFGLHTRIIPGVNLLKGILGNNENVVEVLNKSRWLYFTNYSMRRLSTNVAILREFGVSDERVVRFILSNPEKLMVNPNVLESKLSYVEERFGVGRGLPGFIHAVSVALYCSEKEVESKMEVFRGYGWCDYDIRSLFRSQPYVLNKSEGNIKEKLEFYMKGLGYTSGYLMSCNTFFTFSLNKRVIPRNDMLKILKEKGLVKEKLSLITIVSYSELKFLDFLREFEDRVPGLCDVYMECIQRGSKLVSRSTIAKTRTRLLSQKI